MSISLEETDTISDRHEKRLKAMLDKKTLYSIYIVHRVNNLCMDNPLPKKIRRDTTKTLEQLRLKSYLYTYGLKRQNLDDASLQDLIWRLCFIVDRLSITEEEKSEIPRSLPQFNQCFKKWLESTQSHQL